MGEERVRTVHAVLDAAPLIFEMPVALFTKQQPRDEADPLLKFLKFPEDSKFPIFAPVLYTNQRKSPQNLFQTRIIGNVCATL